MRDQKITRVEPNHLRLPTVTERCDGSEETLIAKMHTDAGITGSGLRGFSCPHRQSTRLDAAWHDSLAAAPRCI